MDKISYELDFLLAMFAVVVIAVIAVVATVAAVAVTAAIDSYLQWLMVISQLS